MLLHARINLLESPEENEKAAANNSLRILQDLRRNANVYALYRKEMKTSCLYSSKENKYETSRPNIQADEVQFLPKYIYFPDEVNSNRKIPSILFDIYKIH